MWAGQLGGELLNWLIKRAIKQERPMRKSSLMKQPINILAQWCPLIASIGNGYGFPSSHSQYMAYFTSFLMCHIYFRHRFSSTGYPVIDFIWRMVVYVGLLVWAGLVAYSRYACRSPLVKSCFQHSLCSYYLGYHNANQIVWGLIIGTGLGIPLYLLAEVIPDRYPTSVLGRVKIMLLDHPVIVWLQIRDGWSIWTDGGREGEWLRWRTQWELEVRKNIAHKQKKR